MKFQDTKHIKWIISTLILLSSFSIIFSITKHYSDSNSKNSILLNISNKYNLTNINSSISNESAYSLINNLNYVKKYISVSVIQKQKILELSIVGSHYDKSDKSTKHYKESEIGHFNRISLIKKNRYRKQAIATINISKKRLKNENNIISKIIPILNEHPYTYTFYLNKRKLIIPNINFFINSNTELSGNNIEHETSSISNNTFNINSNNINLNTVSLSSEEQGVSAKVLTAAGSSLSKVWFHQISFRAKIITFNPITNSYQYSKVTTKDTSSDIENYYQLKNNLFNNDNSEILDRNGVSKTVLEYFNSSRNNLSNINSLAMSISYSINGLVLPSYFNTHIGTVAKASFKYNNISAYKHNQLWYDFGAAVLGVQITTSISVVYAIITIRKIERAKFLYYGVYNRYIESYNKALIQSDLNEILRNHLSFGETTSSNDLDILLINTTLKLNELQSKVKSEYFSSRRLRTDMYNVLENIKTNAKDFKYRSNAAIMEFNEQSVKYNYFRSKVMELKNSVSQIDKMQNMKQIDTFISETNIIIKKLINDSNKIILKSADRNYFNTTFYEIRRTIADKRREAEIRVAATQSFDITSTSIQPTKTTTNSDEIPMTTITKIEPTTDTISKDGNKVEVINHLLLRLSEMKDNHATLQSQLTKCKISDTENRKITSENIKHLEDQMNYIKSKLLEINNNPENSLEHIDLLNEIKIVFNIL